MQQPFLSNRVYLLLFSLLGAVYLAGLFVPLMDNDAAHHAIIALRMHITGDYISLYDYGQDYLDKPHLHFWLCALSYKIFGVNSFAYRFPSFLFTIGGVYSVYKLGKHLYGTEVGKLSALMIASAFAFILANNDVRMDAILTACIAFATWQLVVMVDSSRWQPAVTAAIGLALGFSTKGHIAVFTPALACLFYMLSKKHSAVFLDLRWLIVLVVFSILIIPEVYAFYQQFNLHPEKMVRGKDHINGVSFILFGQSVERFRGEMGSVLKNDHFFFFHSFLWAFAPWSLITFISFISGLKKIRLQRQLWMTHGVFAVMALLISFSAFKLPHYLNILFPVCAIMSASFLLQQQDNKKWIRILLIVQCVVSFIILLAAAVANSWVFPVHGFLKISGTVLLLALAIYCYKSSSFSGGQKTVLVPVASMILLFFLMNTNFYPALLQYQGGNTLAEMVKGRVDPESIYFEPNSYSPSFNFYMNTLRRPLTDTIARSGKKIWVFSDKKNYPAADSLYHFGRKIFEVKRYWITRLNLKFLNPSTREQQCTRFYLAEMN